MESSEDRLPPKQRLSRIFRTGVGDDIKARSFCPINGTRLDGQVKRKAEVEVEVLRFEMNQDREHQATGSKRTKAKAESSFGSAPPPIFADAPTVLHPPTTQPTALAAANTSVQETYYHTWSIHDPPSTPAVAVVKHGPTATTHITSQPPDHRPPPSTTSREQYLGCNVGSHFQDTPSVKPSPGPSTTLGAGKAYATTTSPATTAAPEVDNRSHPNEPSVNVASLPPLIASELSAPQDDQDSVDLFNAVYQSFFIPRSLDGHGSSTQGLAPVPSRHYADTPQPVSGERAPQSFLTASTSASNTISTTARHSTVGRDLRDACQPSDATKLESGNFIDWSRSPADVAHVDRGRSADIGRLFNVGYGYQLQSGLPEAAYTNMHPVPPAPHSSYSELAGALEYRECAFVDDYVPSRAHRRGATPRAMSSLVPAIAFYIRSSHSGVRIDSPSQAPRDLWYPEEVLISEDEFAQCFQEYPHYSERLFSETVSFDIQ